eukprot:scaffold13473_cov241-Alexandrium_tamarense.AAC.1
MILYAGGHSARELRLLYVGGTASLVGALGVDVLRGRSGWRRQEFALKIHLALQRAVVNISRAVELGANKGHLVVVVPSLERTVREVTLRDKYWTDEKV